MSQNKRKMSVRMMVTVAMMAAVSYVLMLFNFSVPFMPPFIKLDVAELPALITSYALGPVAGICVSLFKNLLHLFNTSTGGVGELSNFLLAATFVGTAGVFYRRKKNRRGALTGALIGAVTMAVMSVLTNYYIVYPVYTAFMPMEGILEAYNLIFPVVDDLWDALILFNMPFTFFKGMLSTGICFMIYKKVAPILRGR